MGSSAKPDEIMTRGKIDNSARLAAVAVHGASSSVRNTTRGAVSLARRWRDLLLPAVLLAGSLVALSVDFPISRWFVGGHCPGFLRDCLKAVEPFGNGLGVIVIVVAVAMLDPFRRAALPRIMAASLGAGLTANIANLIIVRTRPSQFTFQGDVWDTFGGFFPLISAGSGGQSFPSAHTATAVGMAVVLSWLYPRGRGLFVVLAMLVACQRIQGGAHYLSDTLAGAAAGCLAAAVCLHRGLLGAWFTRYEYHFHALERPVLRIAPESGQPGPDRRAA
jgi:membrane-associated phospholipid phosphatase